MSIAPPEIIIEPTDFGGKMCVIFDPVSGGEYSSFVLDLRESVETRLIKMRKALTDADDIFMRMLADETINS